MSSCSAEYYSFIEAGAVRGRCLLNLVACLSRIATRDTRIDTRWLSVPLHDLRRRFALSSDSRLWSANLQLGCHQSIFQCSHAAIASSNGFPTLKTLQGRLDAKAAISGPQVCGLAASHEQNLRYVRQQFAYLSSEFSSAASKCESLIISCGGDRGGDFQGKRLPRLPEVKYRTTTVCANPAILLCCMSRKWGVVIESHASP